MEFDAKIEIIGINPFVFVPDAILQNLFKLAGKDKGHIPVKGIINGSPYRQTLVRYSGAWRLYINHNTEKFAKTDWRNCNYQHFIRHRKPNNRNAK